MKRTILFRDGVFYDEKWNAIIPTLEERMALTMAVSKYAAISDGDAQKKSFLQKLCTLYVNDV